MADSKARRGEDTFGREIDMKAEELIGCKVWIKKDQFRSVPGKIEIISHAANGDDIKSSVSHSTFRIEMSSGTVIEVLGSDISKIEMPAYAEVSIGFPAAVP
jgi:hypothetical protein